jgi:hypothetical protein
MRRFRPHATADEVSHFLTELGYELEDACFPDGGEPFGFYVRGTTLQYDYDILHEGHVIGYGGISLNNHRAIGDPELQNRSSKLFNRLYRRFRYVKADEGRN